VVDSLWLPNGGSVPLVDGMRIGRDSGCEVRLVERSVSREHAAIHHGTFGRWYVEDLGSRNGTYLDKTRLAAGTRAWLRDGCHLDIATVRLVVSLPPDATDAESTTSLELPDLAPSAALSPYQLQVVQHLAAPWLAGDEEPASNAAIAQALGTPAATEAVKAALRRIYVKVGLSDAPDAGKRRSLCRLARELGWV
jgi:pSer/pThr/pTyr-binding forkhead associated (FHA) protein